MHAELMELDVHGLHTCMAVAERLLQQCTHQSRHKQLPIKASDVCMALAPLT